MPPASGPDHPRASRRYRTGRMEAFSDGVFAFAITLLVLDLTVPEGSGRDLLAAVLALWPHYLTYVVSFATIGAVWLTHNAITEHLDHADSTFMRLNLLPLLFVAFIPFPTRFLAQYIDSEQPERIAILLYGISAVLLFGALVLLRWYAGKAGLLRAAPGDGELSVYQRMNPGLVAYALLIVLGLFFPVAAVFGFLVIAVFIILPLRLRRHPRA